MPTLSEKLQTTITDFIAQRDARWLLVAAAADDAPLVFKLLGDCERNSRGEVFLIFGAPFRNAEQYAEEIVALFRAEYTALNEARIAQKHPPLTILDENFLVGDPVSRIVAVIDAARSLLPEDGLYRLVCAFWPLEVADPVAYGKFLAALIAQTNDYSQGTAVRMPWQQSVRLIAREHEGVAPLPDEPDVLRTRSDFSAAALLRSLQRTIDDPQQPEAVRMQALFTQATMDQAHARLSVAVEKYKQLLTYYRKQRNSIQQTVVLLQLGEAYQKQQRLPEARACYEQALQPAAAVPVPLCAALLARNLGEVAFLQQRYADAATAYQTWHRIAVQLGDHEGVAAALVKLAVVQERLGAIDGPKQVPYFAEAAR